MPGVRSAAISHDRSSPPGESEDPAGRRRGGQGGPALIGKHLPRPVPASLARRPRQHCASFDGSCVLTMRPQCMHCWRPSTPRFPSMATPRTSGRSCPRPTSDMVLSLSPALAELTVVLPAIGAAARQLGWVVLDPQSGEVWLPSGKVLGRGEDFVDRPAAAPPADLDTSPAARKAWLKQSLAPMFTRRGWRSRRGEICFDKALPCLHAQVYLDTQHQVSMRHGLWLCMRLPALLSRRKTAMGDRADRVPGASCAATWLEVRP